MEINNPLYKKQGIHVVASIFTVEKGITKVLLIKRKNNPFINMWALVGGALYNNEDLLDGARREIFEKTGIHDIDLYLSNVYGAVNRSPVMRMVGISFIGVIDCQKVSYLKQTLKTSDADWVPLNKIPDLAYDHNQILNDSIEKLKEMILSTNILRSLFPNGFTLPELQKTYETILNIKMDRRNFRKKIINNDLVVDTKKNQKFMGMKPAKVYEFKNKKCR